MGDGADFRSYLAARWPALFRTLVLLGHPPREAEEIAVDGLARCSPHFDRERREGDVDTWVYATVLDARARRLRRRPGDSPTPEHPVEAVVLPGHEDRAALLEALEEALAGLPEEQRLVVVLRFAAELDDLQVSEVLGTSVDLVEQRVADALAAIDVEALQQGAR